MNSLCKQILGVFLLAATLGAAAADAPLPDIEDISVQTPSEIVSTPSNPLTDSQRKCVLAQKWLDVAQAKYAAHQLEDALVAYQRASAIDERTFSAYVNRGIVYGDLGRWSSAFSDFRKKLRQSHSVEDVAEIIEYLLKHGKNDVAIDLLKSLNEEPITTEVLILRSTVFEANHRISKAIDCANKAFYLASIRGENSSKASAILQRLGQTVPATALPNQSRAEEFWRIFDDVTSRDHAPERSQLAKFVRVPAQPTGWTIINHVKTVSGYRSISLDDLFLAVSMWTPDQPAPPFLSLEPNFFNCCLREADLRRHFPTSLEPVESTGLGGDASAPQPMIFAVKKPWGAIQFGLYPTGYHYLDRLTIYWLANKDWKAVQSSTPPPQDDLVVARRELNARHFVQARRALCSAVNNMYGNSNYRTGTIKRYREIKQEFSNLYKQMHRPEVAEYCRTTSFIDLYKVCQSTQWGLVELPEFSPFAHEKWRVNRDANEGGYFLGVPAFGSFWSRPENSLTKYLKATVPKTEWPAQTVEIERPSPELIDAGYFGDD